MKRLILIVMVLLPVIMWDEAFADRPSGGGGGMGMGTPHVGPVIPVYAPKSFAELSANFVLGRLTDIGLTDRDFKPEVTNKDEEYGSVRMIVFIFNGFKAYICEFRDEGKLEKASEKVQTINKDRIAPNWSMIHKNILFSIDGNLPYINFQDFQKAIHSL